MLNKIGHGWCYATSKRLPDVSWPQCPFWTRWNWWCKPMGSVNVPTIGYHRLLARISHVRALLFSSQLNNFQIGPEWSPVSLAALFYANLLSRFSQLIHRVVAWRSLIASCWSLSELWTRLANHSCRSNSEFLVKGKDRTVCGGIRQSCRQGAVCCGMYM